jgi:hypothetical protein
MAGPQTAELHSAPPLGNAMAPPHNPLSTPPGAGPTAAGPAQHSLSGEEGLAEVMDAEQLELSTPLPPHRAAGAATPIITVATTPLHLPTIQGAPASRETEAPPPDSESEAEEESRTLPTPDSATVVTDKRTLPEIVKAGDWTVLCAPRLRDGRPLCLWPNGGRFTLRKPDGKPYYASELPAYQARILALLLQYYKRVCPMTGSDRALRPTLKADHVVVRLVQPDTSLREVCQDFYISLPPVPFAALICALLQGEPLTIPVGAGGALPQGQQRKDVVVTNWVLEDPTAPNAGDAHLFAVYMQVATHSGAGWTPQPALDRSAFFPMMDILRQAIVHWGGMRPASPREPGLDPEDAGRAQARNATIIGARALRRHWLFRSVTQEENKNGVAFLLLTEGFTGQAALLDQEVIHLPVTWGSQGGPGGFRLTFTNDAPGEEVTPAERLAYNALWDLHRRNFLPLAIYLELPTTTVVALQRLPPATLMTALMQHAGAAFAKLHLTLRLQDVPPKFARGTPLSFRTHELTSSVSRLFFAPFTWADYKMLLSPMCACVRINLPHGEVHRAFLGPHPKSVGCLTAKLTPTCSMAIRKRWLASLPPAMPESPYTPTRPTFPRRPRHPPREDGDATPRTGSRPAAMRRLHTEVTPPTSRGTTHSCALLSHVPLPSVICPLTHNPQPPSARPSPAPARPVHTPTLPPVALCPHSTSMQPSSPLTRTAISRSLNPTVPPIAFPLPSHTLPSPAPPIATCCTTLHIPLLLSALTGTSHSSTRASGGATKTPTNLNWSIRWMRHKPSCYPLAMPYPPTASTCPEPDSPQAACLTLADPSLTPPPRPLPAPHRRMRTPRGPLSPGQTGRVSGSPLAPWSLPHYPWLPGVRLPDHMWAGPTSPLHPHHPPAAKLPANRGPAPAAPLLRGNLDCPPCFVTGSSSVIAAATRPRRPHCCRYPQSAPLLPLPH